MITLKQFKLFYHERFVFHFLNTALACWLLIVVWIVVIIQPRSGDIALHYDIFFGVDRIGPWSSMLVSALLVALLVAGNTVCAYKVYPRDKYLSYYLIIAAALSTLLYAVHLISLSLFALDI